MEDGCGRLTVIATPIGNLGDLSPRAKEALESASAWIVEDTRVSGKLQVVLGLKKPMWVLNDHTTDKAVNQYLDRIEEGQNVVLLTDGGTPVISDPGTELVDGCYDREILLDAIPGPSAVTNALSLSGFYGQRYAFLGFLPKKPGDISKLFKPFADSPMTLVYFDSPFRTIKSLEAVYSTLGERRIAICREMTKIHQEVRREHLSKLEKILDFQARGEVTVVIEGIRRKGVADT